ncbi:M35 family metallo-endopeptidase [Ruegeria sp. HKCCD6109]|uniref:M35 family metallo-endopeptidase n=1 Tax=Ruegeria sp. HKCCD6109 TaxID=2683017 RepID=UPI001492FC8A|nr:M35 family metallo-endopeptidase [Ruegeria sp. HKCCD6109]NOD62718.1 hypothetical protein [Ruegeria sp. HKCCD6109]
MRKAINNITFLTSILATQAYSQTVFPCTDEDQEIANEALSTAQEMLEFAIEGFDGGGIDFGLKAGIWLGARNSTDAEEIRDTYERALVFSEGMKFLCAVDSSFNAIAAVNQDVPVPYIMLGEAFFGLEDNGFDSQPGSVIHELTHGLLVEGTNFLDSERYGTDEALKLAEEDPRTAMSNADNYQYFIEAYYFSLDPP